MFLIIPTYTTHSRTAALLPCVRVHHVSLHSPVRGRQDVGVGVRCEHQLSSDGFHHQALGDAQQEVLVRVSWEICRAPPRLGVGQLFQTFRGSLGVHRAALFPSLGHSLRR